MASGTLIHRRPSRVTREKHPTPKQRTEDSGPRERSVSDFSAEKFSFDKDHIKNWTIPVPLLVKLPPEIQKPAKDWQYAGASLCTALDRIKALDDESFHRGYPDAESSSHPHLLRRTSTVQSSASVAGAGNDTPPMSSHGESAPASFTGLPSSFTGQRQVVDMESPPFTPVDSRTCPTPEYPNAMAIPKGSMPDVYALSRQLSPISLRGRVDSTASTQYTTVVFDEPAWDVYVNTFKAEMDEVQAHAMPRLKGLGGQMERLCLEYTRDEKYTEAIKEFCEWWIPNKGKVAKVEERVRKIELPSIDYMRKERLSMGLPI